MTIDHLKISYDSYKEIRLKNRYIHNEHILPLIENLKDYFIIEQIGCSVLDAPIHSIKIGSGPNKVLMWSQMHGNESTTTKAVFDVCKVLALDDSKNVQQILKNCTILIIPILNPDGAKLYTRENANHVDLNRDAKNCTQPESKILRNLYNSFKPHFCFNLHGQRTIFGAGATNKTATLSFLSPAQDGARTVTETRKKAMQVIVAINDMLQQQIPNQIGVYDDTYNDNCVGDTFQALNSPTILFEAGHFKNDYNREITRFYMFQAIIYGLYYIANNRVMGVAYESYFEMPENCKNHFDVIIRNAKNWNQLGSETIDIAIQYQEVLKNNKIDFVPVIEQIGDLDSCYGHKEICANKCEVLTNSQEILTKGTKMECVFIDNVKYSINLT
ncbi:MAG: M14 family zinc carboxypeptidase [Xanthomarina sp.]